MIVGSYLGPATVVLPDGTVFSVVAHLQSAGAAGAQLWRGVLTAEDEQALWDTLRMGVQLTYSVWLRCLRIFADESIEDRSSPYPCHSKICDWRRGRVGGGRELMSCLVRPVPVVVGEVRAKRGE